MSGSRSVVVLGMHRSGTSAVTGLLYRLGLHAPPKSDLLGANESNPSGHWESRNLTRFNDGLLLAFGGVTFAPPALPSGWEAGLRPQALRPLARALFRRCFPRTPWAWKDPQLCITLPFWMRVFDHEPVVLFVRRSPAAICASLAKRDGMPPDYALAAWERYTRSALLATADQWVLTLDYDALVDAPMREIPQMMWSLGREGVALHGDTKAAALTIESAFRHHGAGLPPCASPQQRRLFDVTVSLPIAGRMPGAAALGSETPGLDHRFRSTRARQAWLALRRGARAA